MDRDTLQLRVREFAEIQPWNHSFDLGSGVLTAPAQQKSHGKNLVKLQRLEHLFELIGLKDKLVLDIGCNEGFFSLHMARRGARVIGIDIDEQRIAKAKFVQSVLGPGDVDFRITDIYSPAFAALPQAALCVCLGVMHRVPDPVSALAAVTAKADMILLEWKALKFGPHDEAFAYFTDKAIDSEDIHGTEYWLLSFAAMERVLVRFGFTHFHRVDDATQRRAVLVASRRAHELFNRPHVNVPRSRLRSLLSHTKRYARTVVGVVTGRVNA